MKCEGEAKAHPKKQFRFCFCVFCFSILGESGGSEGAAGRLRCSFLQRGAAAEEGGEVWGIILFPSVLAS